VANPSMSTHKLMKNGSASLSRVDERLVEMQNG
jgi:hypothetical protein